MATVGRPVIGIRLVVVLLFTVVWQEVRLARRFATSGCFANHPFLQFVFVVRHDVDDFVEILPLSDVERSFMLKILELHGFGFQKQLRQFPSTHCTNDVKRRVVVQVEGVDVTFGRDENSNDSGVTIPTGSVQWSVAIIVVKGSAASAIQQLTQRLIMSVLGGQVKC